MSDLTTSYLGLTLRSPIVASPSPVTGRLESLRALDEAGVGAVVLPSLFEEEVESESLTLNDRLEEGAGVFAEAADYFPDLDFGNLGLDRHVRLVEQAAEELSVPVIASVNARTVGGWLDYAQMMVDAGAEAIELNMYDVAADPDLSAADVEQGYLDLVAQVSACISVPLSVKLSPYFSSFGHMAREVVDAGADGLVLFNRFYQPDLDLESLDVTPRLELSTSAELRLPLRWIGLLRPHLAHTSLALTSGVHDGLDVAKGLLAGADVVMAASALLHHGPDHVRTMTEQLQGWLQEHEYVSVDQLRGSVARHAAADPSAYERSQYLRVLSSWRR
ncbi:MAG: dihydroorotate dehydrogenase-like protein [Candidatus Nanopelagicales bacterium]